MPGYSNISNKADYKVSHAGGGFSSSGNLGAQAAINAASTLMSAVGSSGHARLLYSNDGLLYITTDHYETATSIGRWK